MAKLAKPDDQGYIPIKRRFFRHPFWMEKRVYSKAEAWLDLIQVSRFEESEISALIGNRIVSWKRGQVPAALRFLAERWGWSKGKVENYIRLCEDEKMITRHLEEGQTIITLCNYEHHNPKPKKQGQRQGQQQGQEDAPPSGIPSEPKDSNQDSEKDAPRTARGQLEDKTNNVNKENKENNVISTGADAPVKTPDEIKFGEFEQWILKWAPRVAKMEKPFTFSEWSTIRKKMDKDYLSKLLRKMHNWKPLLKKNVSAYLTALNWTDMNDERQTNHNQINGHNGSATKQGQKIAAAIEQIEGRKEKAQQPGS